MKRILLPFFIFLSVILVACGNGNTKPLTSDAGGGTPTPASTSTPTPAPTSTPVPTEMPTPTETPVPTDTPVPTMQGALGGFAATDQENVYINDKVTSPSIPRWLIRLKDRFVTLYEDEVVKRYSVEERKYAVTVHNTSDWNKVGEKKLQNLYTFKGMGFRWQLTSEMLPGENAFLIIDGGDPYYTLDIYDQDLNVIEYNRTGSVHDFIVDDANDRLILYDGMDTYDDPFDQHIYEYKYKTGELNKLSDIKSDDAQWLYYQGITDNDKLMLTGMKTWGSLDDDFWWNYKLYTADINTGELTELGFLDLSFEYYTQTDPGISVVPDPKGKRCVVKSSGDGTAYVYDWGRDKRVDIKLNDVDKATVMDKDITIGLECVVDWKHNALITYGEYYEGNMYCYSLETGELIGTIYNRYASFAIPALDEDNGLLYFYGMNGEDSEAPLALHVWDYLGIND